MDIIEHHIDENNYLKIYIFTFNDLKKHVICKQCIDFGSAYSDSIIYNKVINNNELESTINEIKLNFY